MSCIRLGGLQLCRHRLALRGSHRPIFQSYPTACPIRHYQGLTSAVSAFSRTSGSDRASSSSDVPGAFVIAILCGQQGGGGR
ncbi:unnamed protein product [Ixodes pacificus]